MLFDNVRAGGSECSLSIYGDASMEPFGTPVQALLQWCQTHEFCQNTCAVRSVCVCVYTYVFVCCHSKRMFVVSCYEFEIGLCTA